MADGYLNLYDRILDEVAISERLTVVAPALGGRGNPLLVGASQLAEVTPRQDKGPTDEELAAV
jgi:hypothetical protein